MKKNIFNPSYRIIIIILIFIVSAIHTQGQRRGFNAKQGDEFTRYVIIKSNCMLQRGDYKLKLSSYSEVSKSYKVDTVGVNKIVMRIVVNKIIDTTNAGETQEIFDSGITTGNESNVQKALAQVVGQAALVSVDANGRIVLVQKEVPADEAMLAFAGVRNEHFVVGGLLDFAIDFPLNPLLKKGYSWTDSVATRKSKFTIYEVNGRLTTITYTTSDKSGTLNTNVNGVILIDNLSGIVLKRSTQSVTVGYEMVKGIVYTATRRTSTAEVCYRKTSL